ncbi:hypothetical protein NRB56_27050 [Nocardia sp. RB56]|uniref:ParB/Sulfiredoxin domain-containing protein n=1 Tax=Nocardia aurantia TaxID=2585199 RepID=A0A7K0DMZ4_9NOCA|nr:hypothetical protein [Nocardia aurantia]
MTTEPFPVRWLETPEDHDYPAAADYLELVADRDTVDTLVELLRAAPVTHKKAKDLLRAAQLSLLPPDNPHVRRDLSKILTGKPLSPILVVRGDFAAGAPAQIADGYHRVCACYHTDENVPIPVKIAALLTPDAKVAVAAAKSASAANAPATGAAEPDPGKGSGGKSKSKK